ncbi:response regulator [Cohnella sp. LGH]|uniref:Two-component system response regulator YesN n=1 Tax=Cohnella phaseoli TaxID=456490 RepID=A0A3D9IAS4_9BACL|nr:MULTISPECIES: response regulator [Cohnella]QTH44999.1 response regulator [Cohnella sp. LGH]RED58760.1 two-component system response regulator YesN [Cohnella phaseoli]
MYKIMLVDDEAEVREGIRRRIAWHEHGFECVSDCENGMDALEAAEQLRPDVVLTDINMPFMDGLELTRQLSERLPWTKVVILTGYDDFDYAQQAVKLRVNDFILKPITAEELIRVLESVKRELDEERDRLENLVRLERQLRESLPALKERFLERMVGTSIGVGEMKQRMAYFGLNLPGPEYVVLAADADHFGEAAPEADRELLRFALHNIVQEIAAREPASAEFRSREEKVVCILSGGSDIRLFDRAQALAEEIRRSVETYLRFTVTVGIGLPVFGLADLRQSYRSAVAALDYRVLLGTNRVISITDVETRRRLSAETTGDWEKRLVVGIKTGSREEADQAVAAIVSGLKEAAPSIEQVYIRIQKLIVSLLNALEEPGGGASPFGEAVNPITEVYRFKTLEEIEIWLKELCRDSIRMLAEKRSDMARDLMVKAEAHIRDNFSDPNLSLKAVCEIVHMSNSYFSALFKARTGKTFVEFLTCQRVEKAKELLASTDLKSYEIAAAVGYADPHYFSVLFKKATGDTPTEYRQKAAVDRERAT